MLFFQKSAQQQSEERAIQGGAARLRLVKYSQNPAA